MIVGPGAVAVEYEKKRTVLTIAHIDHHLLNASVTALAMDVFSRGSMLKKSNFTTFKNIELGHPKTY